MMKINKDALKQKLINEFYIFRLRSLIFKVYMEIYQAT